MLAIRFHQKSNIFREKVYFFFKNVRKSSSLQTKKYHFPLTTAPTFFRCKTQKMYTAAGLPRTHDFEWLEQEFSWFSRTIWTETNRKTKFLSFDEKNPNTTAIRFHQKPTIFKEKKHFFLKVFKKLMIEWIQEAGWIIFLRNRSKSWISRIRIGQQFVRNCRISLWLCHWVFSKRI